MLDTVNAIEKAVIAKNVAIYIIDHILVEEPMSAAELEMLAVEIIEDRGIKDADEFADITHFAINYVSNDPRVVVSPKGKVDAKCYGSHTKPVVNNLSNLLSIIEGLFTVCHPENLTNKR